VGPAFLAIWRGDASPGKWLAISAFRRTLIISSASTIGRRWLRDALRSRLNGNGARRMPKSQSTLKATIRAAFDAALKVLHDTSQPTIVREIILARIVEAARSGERDPVRLQEAALPWLDREWDSTMQPDTFIQIQIPATLKSDVDAVSAAEGKSTDAWIVSLLEGAVTQAKALAEARRKVAE
jgi:hypothetical protein